MDKETLIKFMDRALDRYNARYSTGDDSIVSNPIFIMNSRYSFTLCRIWDSSVRSYMVEAPTSISRSGKYCALKFRDAIPPDRVIVHIRRKSDGGHKVFYFRLPVVG
jgi:hypothetical protein